MEANLVEMWLRKDQTRWIAGAAAGFFAGLVAIAFGMILSVVGGLEFWFPIKLMGTLIAGSHATEIGMHLPAIVIGFAVFEALCMIFGVAYAHFVYSNDLPSLLAMGLVWGTFSWIFIWNLFLPAFRVIVAAHVSPAAAFPVCIAYGLALTSVAFFDRALRS